MTYLENICPELPQIISEAITQASGEDIDDMYRGQGLKTHNSKSSLIWDLIIRNITNSLPNSVLSSTATCGTWEILLLYCKGSRTLISLMRKARFNDLKNGNRDDLPNYLKALLALNRELKANPDQLSLPLYDPKNYEEDFYHNISILCSNFDFPVKTEVQQHALVVFEVDQRILVSLDVYALTPSMEKTDKINWLNISKPIMDMGANDERDTNNIQLTLKDKAHERVKATSNISLKEASTTITVQQKAE